MKLKTTITFTIGFIAAVIFFSCKHDIPAAIPPPVSNTVFFEEDVLPIFQSNCAKSGCHDATSREENYQLDSFNNIVSRGIIAGDSSNSRIYQVITSTNPDERMPKEPNVPLTDAQKHTIATWIKEGANNKVNTVTTCDSSDFTYSGAVKPILQTHCLGCHSGLAIDGGYIPLDTYDGILEQVTFNFLYPAITHTGFSPMPQNGNKLNDCKIARIRKWIEAGAPNN